MFPSGDSAVARPEEALSCRPRLAQQVWFSRAQFRTSPCLGCCDTWLLEPLFNRIVSLPFPHSIDLVPSLFLCPRVAFHLRQSMLPLSDNVPEFSAPSMRGAGRETPSP